MDDLAFLHGRIESYADYTNDDERRLSDEQIRAYVGESLAKLRERVHAQGADGEMLEQLVLRCQFADQNVIRMLGETTPSDAEKAQLHTLDRALVELADRGAAIDAGGLSAYLTEVGASLDRRKSTIVSVAAP